MHCILNFVTDSLETWNVMLIFRIKLAGAEGGGSGAGRGNVS